MVSMLRFASVVACLAVVGASDFLAATTANNRQSISKEAVEQMLSLASSARLSALTEKLKPTFAALPKNAQGQLDPSTVRYALHRHFVAEHGLYVKGLDPEGAGWNFNSSASAAGDILKGLAPAYVQELLAKRGHSQGLSLNELAVFAETLSDLMFQEALGDFREVYDKLELDPSEAVSESAFDEAIRVWLASLITARSIDFNGKQDMAALEWEAKDWYAEYDDIVMWFRDLYHSQNYLEQHHRNPFIAEEGVSYDRASGFLQGFLHHFGSLSEKDCRTLKDDLMSIEQPGTGRVLLSDFYAKELQLHESVDYLRNLGALENTSGTPMLIMANYITSPSRCMPFSSYYSICCPDECDALMDSLEHDIGLPNAEPARIAELVEALPSDTVDAPRNLSTVLLARLDEIARHHDGSVPLHGRLFMQWMHHAYPRECPFPHAAGTTSPVSQDEWLNMHEHLDNATAYMEEKQAHMRRSPAAPMTLEDLPWSAVEELVAVDKPSRQPRSRTSKVLRTMMALIAVVSFALPLVHASRKLFAGAGAEEKTAHLV